MHPAHQAFDTSGGGSFALPGHSDQQLLQGVNPQWQQMQQDGSARHAYANNAAGTNYANFAPQFNQSAGIYPNADFAPPMGAMQRLQPMQQPQQRQLPPPDFSEIVTSTQTKFMEDQNTVIRHLMDTINNMIEGNGHRQPLVQPPQQQPGAAWQNAMGAMPYPPIGSQQLQMQQPAAHFNAGFPQQHNNEMMAQRHDPSLDPPQPVQPTSPNNISYSPSVASHPVCPPVNGVQAEDSFWQQVFDDDSTDGAMPAAAANNHYEEVVSPTRSLSMGSPQAAPTPGSPNNSQLLPPPMAGAPATAACESEGAQPLSPLSSLQPQSGLETRPKSASGGRLTSSRGQAHLPGDSRFDPFSIDRNHRAIFLCPGKNGMVHLNLSLAMDGFSEEKESSQKSIRHFIERILKKVFKDPNASTCVTAACEKSRKGNKILPKSSIDALAAFWISHFKSTNIHGRKEVAEAMGALIKACLVGYRKYQGRN